VYWSKEGRKIYRNDGKKIKAGSMKKWKRNLFVGYPVRDDTTMCPCALATVGILMMRSSGCRQCMKTGYESRWFILEHRKDNEAKRALDRLLNTTSQPINDMEVLDRLLFESLDRDKTGQEKSIEFLEILILCGFDVVNMDMNLSSFADDENKGRSISWKTLRRIENEK
jgi:hypothetical protein